MDDATRYRALEAFCRQRAKFDNENSAFWLEEAQILARLVTLNDREQALEAHGIALQQIKDKRLAEGMRRL